MIKMDIYKVLLIIAAVTFVSCSNSNLQDSNDLNIVNLRSAGQKLPGTPKYNVENCKPEDSYKTLTSLRYVGNLPIYYMDYWAQVDWKSFEKDQSSRYAVNDLKAVTKEVNDSLYKKVPVEDNTGVSNPQSACSGFVCFNPDGDLLFGRNYDANTEPLVVVFNQYVGNHEHKSVMMTGLNIAQMVFGEKFTNDSSLLDNNMDLSILLRQPLAILDGMNDAGLCIAAYQLPSFQEGVEGTGSVSNLERPHSVDVKGSHLHKQISQFFLHRKLLTECETVGQALTVLKRRNDYTTALASLNIHWYIADAKNNWCTVEFWRDKDGRDSLVVMNEQDRYEASYAPGNMIPYEYRGIENYYCNKEAGDSFLKDEWQYTYTNKARIHNMMSHYQPVMTEAEALQCLQYGTYKIEVPDKVTDWSCVYNPRKKKLIFNMRNDMSTVYSVELPKDFEK